MTVTKTIYPPAGATALLAAVDPQVEHLGWFLLPLIILSAALTLVVSLLLNNIQRQYPTYWWTPTDIGIEKKARDTEKVPESSRSSSLAKAIAHTKSSEGNSIQITPDHIYVPKDIFLAGEERGIMEALQGRLRNEHAQEPETAVQPVDPA